MSIAKNLTFKNPLPNSPLERGWGCVTSKLKIDDL
jgi:hypothetical protein